MKIWTLLFSILPVFVQGELYAQAKVPANILRIDPDNAFGGRVGKLFDEIEYIPLESKKESLFNRIDRLEVTNEYFVIMDDLGDAIVVFERSGKFHSRLARPKEGKEPGRRAFRFFSVDRAKNEILVESGLGGLDDQLFIYDFNGKLLQTKKKGVQNSFQTISLGNLATLSNFYPPEGRNLATNQLVIQKPGAKKQEFLPYPVNANILPEDRFADGEFLYGSGQDTYFFRNFYGYNLYEIGQAGVKNNYQIILPARFSLPAGFLQDSTLVGKRMKYMEDHPSMVYCFSDLYKTQSVLLFRISLWQANYKDRTLFYHFGSGNLYSLSRISSDSTNGFLPIRSLWDRVIGCDGSSFYTSVSSFNMFEAKRLAESKSPQRYSEVLDRYFKSPNKNGNPVIVRLKFKTTI